MKLRIQIHIPNQFQSIYYYILSLNFDLKFVFPDVVLLH